MKAENGIPYFPLNCTFNDSVELMIAEFGMKGLGILIRLYQKIYSSKGYYIDWNADVELMFSRNCGLGVASVSEVLQCCLKRNIFDNEMYRKFNILTSEGIQERYFDVVKRRKEIEIIKEYLLIAIPSNSLNVNILSENVCKTSENVCNSEQRRVKESKEKKSRVKESNVCGCAHPTLKELNAYCSQNNFTIDCERFIDYYSSNGWKVGRNPMKDWKATVRNWARKEKSEVNGESSFDIDKFNDYENNLDLNYKKEVEK